MMCLLLLLFAALTHVAAQTPFYHVCSQAHGCCSTINGACTTPDGQTLTIFSDKWCNSIGVGSADRNEYFFSGCLMAGVPNSTCSAVYLSTNLGAAAPDLMFLVTSIAGTAEYTVANYAGSESCRTQNQTCSLNSGNVLIGAINPSCFGKSSITWYMQGTSAYINGCLVSGPEGLYQDFIAAKMPLNDQFIACPYPLPTDPHRYAYIPTP
jgi:hypothetical protein